MEGIAVGFVLLAAVALSWHFRRSRDILAKWVADNAYTLEQANYCMFWRGPYMFRSGESHSVYRVTVRDTSGNRRRGYVRCGGWFLGLWSNKSDVRWDR